MTDFVMPRTPCLAIVLAASLAAGACAPGAQDDAVTRTDSAGVEIVVASAPDVALPWLFEEQFSLGGAAEGPESFYVLAPGYIATDSLGQIYVLDSSASRVLIFTGEGDFVRSLGREGEGPGEITVPASIAVSSAGDVAVFDLGKGSLVRFSADGTPLPETPFQLRPLPNRQRHIAFFGEGMLVSSRLTSTSDDEMAYGLYWLHGPDTTVVADVSFPSPMGAMYPSCGGGLRIPRLFEPELVWSVAAGAMVVSSGPRYELDLYSGPALVRRFGRDMPVRAATEQLAVRELGEGFTINFGSGPCTIEPREMVEGRGFAPTVPWVQDVTLTPTGQTWVRRKEVGPSLAGPVDVFDSSGAYLGTLPPGTSFPLLFLSEDRFAAAETDDVDVTRLVVYQLHYG